MIFLCILSYFVVGFLASVAYLKCFHNKYGRHIMDGVPSANALFVMIFWPIMGGSFVLYVTGAGILKIFDKINNHFTPPIPPIPPIPPKPLTAIEHIATTIDE